MGVQVYGLWPHALDRLTTRTGKIYKFMVATVSAESEQDARRFADEQQGDLGIDWNDATKIACKSVATMGDMPTLGRVFYQWSTESKT